MVSRLSEQAKGILFATCGSLLGGPDAVFLRLAAVTGASQAAVIFWKFVNVAIVAFMVAGHLKEDEKNTVPKIHWIGSFRNPYLWMLALSRAVLNISLSLAFLLTLTSNAILIFSTNVIWTALLEAYLIEKSKKISYRTQIALAASMASIAGMTVPDIIMNGHSSGNIGDELALLAAFMCSLNIVLARKAPPGQVCIPFSGAFGTLLAALFVGISTLLTAPNHLVTNTSLSFLVYILLDGACIGALIVCFALSTYYINGTQIALISLLQNILGPLCTFAVFGEVPPTATLIGGFILIIIITWHEWLSLSEQRNAKQTRLPSVSSKIIDFSPPPKTYIALSTVSSVNDNDALDVLRPALDTKKVLLQ